WSKCVRVVHNDRPGSSRRCVSGEVKTPAATHRLQRSAGVVLTSGQSPKADSWSDALKVAESFPSPRGSVRHPATTKANSQSPTHAPAILRLRSSRTHLRHRVLTGKRCVARQARTP